MPSANNTAWATASWFSLPPTWSPTSSTPRSQRISRRTHGQNALERAPGARKRAEYGAHQVGQVRRALPRRCLSGPGEPPGPRNNRLKTHLIYGLVNNMVGSKPVQSQSQTLSAPRLMPKSMLSPATTVVVRLKETPAVLPLAIACCQRIVEFFLM